MEAEVKTGTAERVVAPPAQPESSGFQRVGYGDDIFRGLMIAFAWGVLLLALIVLWQLIVGSWNSITTNGFNFLTSTRWNADEAIFSALPPIYGTVVSAIIALLIAVPLSVGSAVFLAELAPKWLRDPASYLVELLAAIPSVVYGLWAVFVLVPIMRNPVESGLQAGLGFLPLFQGRPGGFDMFTAGVILAIMIMPIITALSRDVILVTPSSQREAYYALGATRWETIRDVVLPFSRSGIIGAIVLGLGRALGETMAVAMVIGNAFLVTPSLFSPSTTMASVIANKFPEAAAVEKSALIQIGLILFIITLFVNIGARFLITSMGTGPSSSRK